jgi:hypothetical protein
MILERIHARRIFAYVCKVLEHDILDFASLPHSRYHRVLFGVQKFPFYVEEYLPGDQKRIYTHSLQESRL